MLRSLEEQLLKGATHNLTIRTRTEVALYILNQKRAHLSDLEQRFGVTIAVLADEALATGTHFTIERGEAAGRREPVRTSVQPDSVQPLADEEPAVAETAEETAPEETEEPVEAEAEREDEDEDARRGRRRRRRGRRPQGDGRREERPEMRAAEPAAAEDEAIGEGEESDEEEDERQSAQSVELDENGQPRRRRRGRRGGRRGRRARSDDRGDRGRAPEDRPAESHMAGGNGAEPVAAEAASLSPAPAGGNGADRPEPSTEEGPEAIAESPPFAPARSEPITYERASPDEAAETREPMPERRPEERVVRSEVEETPAPPPPEPPAEEEDPNRPKRSGWWQRRSFF